MGYLVSSSINDILMMFPHITLKEGFNVIAIERYSKTPFYFKIDPPNRECLMEVKGMVYNVDIVHVFNRIQNECIMWSEY